VERRTVGQIDAALSAAQQDYLVLAVWRRTGGCVDVTLTNSATACRAVTDLRQGQGRRRRPRQARCADCSC
jgi:hypothetical protein